MHVINQRVRNFLILLFALAGSTSIQAQNPLERKVSLELKRVKIAEVLKQMENQARLSFSYNPELVRDDKIVDAHFKDKPVRFVLDQIFHGWVEYRTKGHYIILQPTRHPPVPKPTFQKIRISGYVIEGVSGNYLKGVSVYDTMAFYSAVTDENGHFELELGENSNALTLLIKKQGYRDTVYFIPKEGFQSVELTLFPSVIEQDHDLLQDSISQDSVGILTQDSVTILRDWKKEIQSDFNEIGHFLNEKLRFNSINIHEIFFKKFQFSLLPGISTNRLLSGNIINDYSLNLIGGYARGVNRMELGGIFNIDQENVRYIQAAGIFNLVGGTVYGLQAAGIFNRSAGNVNGIQTAGIFNSNKGNVTGIQAAGIFNFNKARVNGLQAAGICNKANEVYGAQVAGIFNWAGKVKGVQIGLINIADTVKGVSLGLFSIVKKGYHKWEVGADELFFTRMAFRTGTNWFHNIIHVGVDPRTLSANGQMLWMIGYGAGTSIPLGKHYLDFDLTFSQIGKGAPQLYLSEMGQTYAGLDFRLAKKISLAAGITGNVFIVDEMNPAYSESFSPIYSKPIVNQSIGSSTIHLQAWIGGRIGLRFF